MPFLATSLADFWRRWHISLSTWLRDYVFIPLGGSRRPMPGVMLIRVLPMAVAGLGRAAAWNFAAVGALWGTGLALQHFLSSRIRLPRSIPLVVGGWLFTQLFLLVSLVFFRAKSFEAG